MKPGRPIRPSTRRSPPAAARGSNSGANRLLTPGCSSTTSWATASAFSGCSWRRTRTAVAWPISRSLQTGSQRRPRAGLALRAALAQAGGGWFGSCSRRGVVLGVVCAGGLLAASTAVDLVVRLGRWLPRADQIALDGAVWACRARVGAGRRDDRCQTRPFAGSNRGCAARQRRRGERDAEPPAGPDSTRPDRIRDGGRARAPRRRRPPGQQLRPAHVRGRGHARARPVGRARHATHEISRARGHRILVVSLAAPPGLAGR